MKSAFIHGVLALSAFAAASPAAAADLPAAMPVKAQVAPVPFDWNGFYIGGHFGYATGTSNWSATEAGSVASTLNGSFDLFNGYDPFKGTGSFFAGLQAGYNIRLPSRLLLGIEADFSAPNTISGNQTVSSVLSGQASTSDTVLQFGTARGRVGYDFGPWMVYGTGGVAWSYDRLDRTQLSDTPFAAAGTTETAFLWRWGWAAGAGVEMPIAPNWSAKFEYLATEFGNGKKSFPIAGQSYTADLSIQSLRIGLNYQLGADLSKGDVFTKGVPALDTENFSVHGQTTLVSQYALPFRAPYGGLNSLASNAGRETFDVDLYVGFRPWEGGEIWVNPEVDQGFGLSAVHLASPAFPAPRPTSSVPRTLMRAYHACS